MIFDWDQLNTLYSGDDVFLKALNKCTSDDAVEIPSDLFFNRQYDQNLGKNISKNFTLWRAQGQPHVGQILSLLCDHFSVPDNHKLIVPAMVACALAEIPNKNLYHNNDHFFEVVSMSLCLSSAHNDLTRSPADRLSIDEVLLLFIAACIHDFAHDGQGNIMDGIHISSRLEKRSLLKSKSYLIDSGLSDDDFAKIKMMVIATDVSRNAQGRSPAGIARDIYLAHEHDNVSIVNIDDFYAPLIANKNLSLMSVLLGEADIAMSSGLDYPFSKEMTKLVAQESSILQPSANTLKGFMEVICHGGYLSRAAQMTLGQSFQAILLEAETDAEKGVLYT
jgi:hypothetical protein